MSYSVHDEADLNRTLKNLGRQTSELADDLEELQGRYGRLDTHLDEVEARVREAEDEVEQLRETQDRLDRKMDSIAAVARQLTGKVGWIERRLLADRDIPVDHLGATDDTLIRLAEQARQGRQSAAVLLSPAERATYEQRIADLAELEENIEQAYVAALAHSATLARTPATGEAHRQAGTAYRSVAANLAGHQRRLPAARAAAERARQAIKQDDQRRQLHGPQVMTGEAARAKLLARLRERLETAIADTALLPAWLVLALGHQPVAEPVTSWMETATDLLAYRMIYQVTDQVDALGPRPVGDDQRDSWHRELEATLRRRRHWPV